MLIIILKRQGGFMGLKRRNCSNGAVPCKYSKSNAKLENVRNNDGRPFLDSPYVGLGKAPKD
jgi:hypothetical protein